VDPDDHLSEVSAMPPGVRSEQGWIGGFRARYEPWWAEAGPRIAAHDYATAFKTYPWPSFDTAPWTPVERPVGASRVAVVTTGGLYRPGIDKPFDGDALEGDSSYREIPRDAAIARLAVAHPHFPHESAEADMNTIFPLDRLHELRAAGAIGDVAPTHFSTMGYAPRAADVAAETAPAIAARMKEEAVDVALLVPV
jgi:hypothetical protein